MGFAAVYPSAPDISANLGSWGNHVLIKHFPDLYLCRLRHNLQSALSEIDAQSWTFIPIPQRINPITFDFGKFTDAPEPIRSARGHVLDLVWMSYTGYAPAMLELVKVSARDDIIRLTPRFTYYLLRISERARLRDPAIARLLGLVHQHLSADERAEIDRRALSRKWPATERMVID